MFIIKLTYKKPIEVIDNLRPAHLEFLDKYYEKGYFIASGRQKPLIGGIIIAICKDKEQLWNIVKEDPFYKEEVADFELTEFDPNKFHPSLKEIIK
ncbi:YciI family protein [Rickettsiales bacterium]|nr:YciI family protein [Rickettsiales bacterium]